MSCAIMVHLSTSYTGLSPNVFFRNSWTTLTINMWSKYVCDAVEISCSSSFWFCMRSVTWSYIDEVNLIYSHAHPRRSTFLLNVAERLKCCMKDFVCCCRFSLRFVVSLLEIQVWRTGITRPLLKVFQERSKASCNYGVSVFGLLV